MLLRDTLDELRWRRAEVGCVGPVMAPVWAPDGSVASNMIPDVALDAVDATEAECARRAESSRVRRLTWELLEPIHRGPRTGQGIGRGMMRGKVQPDVTYHCFLLLLHGQVHLGRCQWSRVPHGHAGSVKARHMFEARTQRRKGVSGVLGRRWNRASGRRKRQRRRAHRVDL